MSFSLDMSAFTAKTEKQLSVVVRKTAIGLFSAVMKSSPVDSGRLRGAWMIDINKFSTTAPTTIRSDAAVTAEIIGTSSQYKAGDVITFSNNVEYAPILEYGLFPWANSAKVVNHFSTQSPAGFVRINVMKFQTFVNQASKGL